METIMSIHVCLISWMNFDYKENVGKEMLVLQIQSTDIVFFGVENMIVVQIRQRMKNIMSIHVCLISQMNFEHGQNGGKKSFSCNSKALMSCIQMLRTWL